MKRAINENLEVNTVFTAKQRIVCILKILLLANRTSTSQTDKCDPVFS